MHNCSEMYMNIRQYSKIWSWTVIDKLMIYFFCISWWREQKSKVKHFGKEFNFDERKCNSLPAWGQFSFTAKTWLLYLNNAISSPLALTARPVFKTLRRSPFFKLEMHTPTLLHFSCGLDQSNKSATINRYHQWQESMHIVPFLLNISPSSAISSLSICLCLSIVSLSHY